jgi:hypothetical protein
MAIRVITVSVLILFVVISLPAQSLPLKWGTVEGVSTEFLRFQEGAPLQVIATGSTGRSGGYQLLGRVYLLNVSNRTIVAYQLGWVVSDRANPALRVPFVGVASRTAIPPFGTEAAAVVDSSLATLLDTLNAIGARFGTVTVGVVQVEFESGEEWRYPLAARQTFQEKYDEELHRRISPILKRQRETIERRAAPEPGAQACAARLPGTTSPGVLARVTSWIVGLVSPTKVYASNHDCAPGL